MNRRFYLTLLAALFTVLSTGVGITAPNTTTIIVLRHADRDTMQPELNATGRARAANLPAVLADLPIDAIYCPDIKRNLDTAAPLAAARGLQVQTLTTVNIGAQILKKHSSGTVVWIGNKTNLADLWEELDLPKDPPTSYGEIFIAVPRNAIARSIQKRRFDP